MDDYCPYLRTTYFHATKFNLISFLIPNLSLISNRIKGRNQVDLILIYLVYLVYLV